MDISMPGRGGIDAIEHIRRFDASARVLVFTMHGGAVYALQAFRAGARGYVTKSSPPDLLVSAVRDVAEGRIAICPEISEALAFDRVQEEKTGLEDLSPREFEIFRMILDARSTDEIAAALNVSRKTVANYHYGIKSKLGAGLRYRAALFRPAARSRRARAPACGRLARDITSAGEESASRYRSAPARDAPATLAANVVKRRPPANRIANLSELQDRSLRLLPRSFPDRPIGGDCASPPDLRNVWTM